METHDRNDFRSSVPATDHRKNYGSVRLYQRLPLSNLDSVVKPRQRAKMAFPHFGSLIDGRRIHDPGVSTM
jgi:hypothetical protein